MNDLKTLINEEYKDITFDMKASYIISLYEKERRKKAGVFVTTAFCLFMIMTVFIRMNPKTVETLMNSTGEFFSNLVSNNADKLSVSETTSSPQPNTSDNLINKIATSTAPDDKREYKKPNKSIIRPVAVKPTGVMEETRVNEYEEATEVATEYENATEAVTEKEYVTEGPTEKPTEAKPQPAKGVTPTNAKPKPTKATVPIVTTEAPSTTVKITEPTETSANIDTAKIKYKVISGNEISIISCIPTNNELIIPETIDGYIVREIDSGILQGYNTVKKVKLPDTVTTIGEKTFKGLKNLVSVNIPKSIKTIGESAFEGCSGISSIELYNVTQIGSQAFKNCNSITNVTIPKTAVKIGVSAFESCNNLRSVNLNSDYEYNNIFSSAYTFLNCQKLEKLVVGEGVTFINSNAFKNCTALKEIELPSTLKEIYSNAFYNCSAIESLTFPEGFTTVYSKAFYNCRSLSEVNLPESLKKVYDSAFYNCTSLQTVTIPRNTTTLAEKCFGYYTSDLRVWDFTIRGYITSNAWPYARNNGFAFENLGGEPVITVVELEKYFVALGEGESFTIKYNVEFPEGETTFTSSDPEVATVDENGTITAHSKGYSTINVTNNSVTRQFIVIVR